MVYDMSDEGRIDEVKQEILKIRLLKLIEEQQQTEFLMGFLIGATVYVTVFIWLFKHYRFSSIIVKVFVIIGVLIPVLMGLLFKRIGVSRINVI